MSFDRLDQGRGPWLRSSEGEDKTSCLNKMVGQGEGQKAGRSGGWNRERKNNASYSQTKKRDKMFVGLLTKQNNKN